MKKFFLSLVALFAVAVSSVNAETVTHVINGDFILLKAGESTTIDGITVTCNSGHVGYGCCGFIDSWEGTFTFTADNGKPISYIYFECIGEDEDNSGGDGWFFDHSDRTMFFCWEGSSDSVTGRLTCEWVWDIELGIEE